MQKSHAPHFLLAPDRAESGHAARKVQLQGENMKSRLLRNSMALAVLALPAGLVIPVPLRAQHPKEAGETSRFPHYVVQDLGTLGGPYSFSYNLNDEGVVSGGSALSTQNGDPSQAIVNAPQTAFLWDRGRL